MSRYSNLDAFYSKYADALKSPLRIHQNDNLYLQVRTVLDNSNQPEDRLLNQVPLKLWHNEATRWADGLNNCLKSNGLTVSLADRVVLLKVWYLTAWTADQILNELFAEEGKCSTPSI